MANFTVSSAVDTMMQSSDTAGIRSSIGAVDYPFTTDKMGSTVQTRNLTSITTSDGYQGQTLVAIYIGSNVTTIGSNAFSYGTFPNIIIPDSVTSIGSNAFAYASAAGGTANITLPTNLTAISSGTFRFSGITSITIPASVTSIGSGAFYYCSYLATINCLATTAPSLGSPGPFASLATTDIHVPVGATGYGTTYGGLTVIADL